MINLIVFHLFSLKGFYGYHDITTIDKGSLLCIESTVGCNVKTMVDSVTIKIITDSSSFKEINVDGLPESLMIYKMDGYDVFPDVVNVFLPSGFSAWLRCCTKEAGKIIIDKDTIAGSTYEGSMNSGTPGIREISVTATSLIRIYSSYE